MGCAAEIIERDRLSPSGREDAAEALDGDSAEVVGEDDEVGRLADLEAALKLFLE
jgi:hypothetical protein